MSFPPRIFKGRDEYLNTLLSSLTVAEQFEIKKWADRVSAPIADVGPYTPDRAEEIAERILESQGLSQAIKQVLRGDIDMIQFAWAFQTMAQNNDQFLTETQKDPHEDGISA
jgi:hypothetical protein